MSVSQVTTHILDTGSGRPAAGVAVEPALLAGSENYAQMPR